MENRINKTTAMDNNPKNLIGSPNSVSGGDDVRTNTTGGIDELSMVDVPGITSSAYMPTTAETAQVLIGKLDDSFQARIDKLGVDVDNIHNLSMEQARELKSWFALIDLKMLSPKYLYLASALMLASAFVSCDTEIPDPIKEVEVVVKLQDVRVSLDDNQRQLLDEVLTSGKIDVFKGDPYVVMNEFAKISDVLDIKLPIPTNMDISKGVTYEAMGKERTNNTQETIFTGEVNNIDLVTKQLILENILFVLSNSEIGTSKQHVKKLDDVISNDVRGNIVTNTVNDARNYPSAGSMPMYRGLGEGIYKGVDLTEGNYNVVMLGTKGSKVYEIMIKGVDTNGVAIEQPYRISIGNDVIQSIQTNLEKFNF